MPERVKEKLVELLDGVQDYGFCRSTKEEPQCRIINSIVADHLIAHGVTVQEWISVKDRLPEENTAALTYRKSGIQVEFRWHKGWDNDEFTPCQVTHWMPLPQPPKGE